MKDELKNRVTSNPTSVQLIVMRMLLKMAAAQDFILFPSAADPLEILTVRIDEEGEVLSINTIQVADFLPPEQHN